MFRVGDTIWDKYGRTFIIVEFVQKTGADGMPYTLYNLYPPATRRIKARERGAALGLSYEPYLYLTGSVLKEIAL